MNWKEFFKPTKSKLIMAIIFICLAIFGFVNFSHTCPFTEVPTPCKQPIISHLSDYASIVFGTYIAREIAGFLQINNSIFLTIIAILIGLTFILIYNYIIASCIINIYNKLKK